MSRSQGHGAAGRILSLKNSINITGKGIRDLPVVAQYFNLLLHFVPPESKVMNKIFAPNREE
jgi:hypothetical protein